MRKPRSTDGTGVGGGHPDVESIAIEQVAERHDQAPREQEHVEQQGADGGDAEDAQRRTARLTDQTSRRESECVHRRVRRNISRRSNVHDEANVAATPSGTANAIERRAIAGVMRTNTSEVS